MTLELLPFCREDFTRLSGWIGSEEALVLWSGPYFTFPLDQAQLQCYVDSAIGSPPPRRIFKALDRTTDEVIGHIELNKIDMRNLAATISKVLVGPEYLRGKGYGSAMVYEVARIAFEEEHLHRLELIVFDFNHAAIKCYKNIGFSIEGHLRDYRKVKGEFWSSYIMSLLEGEWITRRRNSSSLSLEPSE